MTTPSDVWRIALSLPAAEKVRDRFAFGVRRKGKLDRLLADNPAKLFTEPHYEGFPAVLVRLDAVSVWDLKKLITGAWRCQAPVDLVRPSSTRRKA